MLERKCFTEQEVRGDDTYALSNDFIIPSFNKHLLNTYCVSDNVLDTRLMKMTERQSLQLRSFSEV